MAANDDDSRTMRMIFRLPEHLYEELKRSAAANNRSMNREVISILSAGRHDRDVGRGGVLDQIEELLRQAAEKRPAPSGSFDRPIFERLHRTIERLSADFGGILSANDRMSFTCDAYVELLSMVSDMGAEEEVEAYFPALEYRLKKRLSVITRAMSAGTDV